MTGSKDQNRFRITTRSDARDGLRLRHEVVKAFEGYIYEAISKGEEYVNVIFHGEVHGEERRPSEL